MIIVRMKDQIFVCERSHSPRLREIKKKGEVADVVSQFVFICKVFHRLNLDCEGSKGG